MSANKDSIENWKNIFAIVQSITTVAAIIVGGWWAYRNFGLQRQEYPRLQIAQKITHFKVSRDYNLLVVDEVLTNTGPVLLQLRDGELRVINVLPLSKATKNKIVQKAPLPSSETDPDTWTILAKHPWTWKENERVIEPGENDQLHCEFLIPAATQIVTVGTYINNPTAPNHRGWSVISVYDLGQVHTNEKVQTNSVHMVSGDR